MSRFMCIALLIANVSAAPPTYRTPQKCTASFWNRGNGEEGDALEWNGGKWITNQNFYPNGVSNCEQAGCVWNSQIWSSNDRGVSKDKGCKFITKDKNGQWPANPLELWDNKDRSSRSGGRDILKMMKSGCCKSKWESEYPDEDHWRFAHQCDEACGGYFCRQYPCEPDCGEGAAWSNEDDRCVCSASGMSFDQYEWKCMKDQARRNLLEGQ